MLCVCLSLPLIAITQAALSLDQLLYFMQDRSRGISWPTEFLQVALVSAIRFNCIQQIFWIDRYSG